MFFFSDCCLVAISVTKKKMQTNTINMTIKLFTVLQTLFLLVNWEISVGFCMRSREVNKEKKEKEKEGRGRKRIEHYKGGYLAKDSSFPVFTFNFIFIIHVLFLYSSHLFSFRKRYGSNMYLHSISFMEDNFSNKIRYVGTPRNM